MREADNLTAVYVPTVHNVWEPQRFTTIWASTIFNRANFNSFFFSSLFKSAARDLGDEFPKIYSHLTCVLLALRETGTHHIVCDLLVAVWSGPTFLVGQDGDCHFIQNI
jgi:hypothetical protein